MGATVKIRVWIPGIATGILILLNACNIFNPSGEGDGGGSGGNVSVGEELYRRGDFAGAMSAFEKAIGEDSGNSMAYYGYAKATLRFYRVNSNGILKDLDSTKDGSKLSFLHHDDATLTARLQAAARVNRVLSLLTERDTLTRWFNYLNDSSSYEARHDSYRAERVRFIQSYLDSADQGFPGYHKRGEFPLSDFVMPYSRIIVDITAMSVLYTITRLYDLDQNDIIDSRDALLKKLDFGKDDGGFSVENLGAIRTDLQNDEGARQNLNSMIQGVSKGLTSSSQLASLIGGSDTGSVTGSSGKDITKTINDLGDAVTFYQFGDRKDNDGDGCIDEEIMDGKDNDGDGFTDEDDRVVLATTPDLIDNDHNSAPDDPREGVDTVVRLDTTTTRFTVRATSGSSHSDTVLVIHPMDSVPRADSVITQRDTLSLDTIISTKVVISRKDTLMSKKDTSVVTNVTSVSRDTVIFPDFFSKDDTTFQIINSVRLARVLKTDTVIRIDSTFTLGFVRDFQNRDEGPFVKIRKGDDNQMPLRIRIQKDSLAQRSMAELAGPYAGALDSAKTYIGGCWRNYTPSVLVSGKRSAKGKR
ncbi:MAG TPA: hypothetical protein DCQ83_08990 [Fibrobacteres bacterium]|nr:hypothetical protein [Fibrobacterota bacterium]